MSTLDCGEGLAVLPPGLKLDAAAATGSLRPKGLRRLASDGVGPEPGATPSRHPWPLNVLDRTR